MFYVDRVELSGGMALFWQDIVNMLIKSYNHFYIDASMGEGGQAWRCWVLLYGLMCINCVL